MKSLRTSVVDIGWQAVFPITGIEGMVKITCPKAVLKPGETNRAGYILTANILNIHGKFHVRKWYRNSENVSWDKQNGHT